MKDESKGISAPDSMVEGLDDVLNDVPNIVPVEQEQLGDSTETEEETTETETKKRGRPAKQKEEVKAEKPEEKESVKEDFKNEEEAEENSEESLIKTIASKLGIELGEDDEFEDSEEGLIAFTERAGKEFADQQLNSFFEEHPDLGEIFDYVMLGGNVEDYYKAITPEIDYKSIDIENEAVQKSVLKTLYRNNGYSDEQITKKLDKFEIAGILKEEAEEASVLLAKSQEKEKSVLIENQRREAEASRQRQARMWGEMEQIVKNRKVQDFEIPVSEIQSTLDYMKKPVKNGMSQWQIDQNDLTLEDRAALAFFMKNKGKLGKYINQAATTQRVSTLRSKLTGGKTSMKSGIGNEGINTNDDVLFDERPTKK
jgi:hypothetical protein